MALHSEQLKLTLRGDDHTWKKKHDGMLSNLPSIQLKKLEQYVSKT